MAGHTPPKVMLRVHVQTTGPGESPMEVTTVALPPQGEMIQIRTLPEVTEQELLDVSQDSAGRVHLLFNHTGQVSLSAVTGEDQGRILVVFVDGFVVYAPIIDQQITDGRLILPHALKPELVQALEDLARQNLRNAAKT